MASRTSSNGNPSAESAEETAEDDRVDAGKKDEEKEKEKAEDEEATASKFTDEDEEEEEEEEKEEVEDDENEEHEEGDADDEEDDAEVETSTEGNLLFWQGILFLKEGATNTGWTIGMHTLFGMEMGSRRGQAISPTVGRIIGKDGSVAGAERDCR